VGSFFGNLFGGGSSSATAKAMPDPATTASTGPSSATSSWSDATTVAAGKIRTAGAAAQPTAVAVTPSARTAPAAPAPAATASPGATPVSAKAAEAAKPQLKGKFRLQVAAVRSRAEAETLAKRLKDAHGSAIAGREPAIEESVIGAMGTFYRVRVGPYADANEPRQLCSKIKPDGFDCLVVTQ
jgi:cell division septation protein DedD